MNIFSRIFHFYYNGFREMTVGKTLWIIILIKLFIIFVILKLFFFPRTLSQFKTEEEKASYILEQLTDTTK
ncbi:MAG TPA: DUF4492 domain-containing protein [Candidatus Avirikenella pullistercoris]|nr:DUF4492 domain-containing protein [Candidatus Avirikenella pullistercoris]